MENFLSLKLPSPLCGELVSMFVETMPPTLPVKKKSNKKNSLFYQNVYYFVPFKSHDKDPIHDLPATSRPFIADGHSHDDCMKALWPNSTSSQN